MAPAGIQVKDKLHLSLLGRTAITRNGVLVTGQTELEVECLPSDLPERIRVDVSGLTDIGNSIHVRDLVLPPKVEVLTDPDELVVLVTAPAAEEKEEESRPDDVAASCHGES